MYIYAYIYIFLHIFTYRPTYIHAYIQTRTQLHIYQNIVNSSTLITKVKAKNKNNDNQ